MSCAGLTQAECDALNTASTQNISGLVYDQPLPSEITINYLDKLADCDGDSNCKLVMYDFHTDTPSGTTSNKVANVFAVGTPQTVTFANPVSTYLTADHTDQAVLVKSDGNLFGIPETQLKPHYESTTSDVPVVLRAPLGYTILKDGKQFSAGASASAASIGDCADKCSGTPGCVGFNFDDASTSCQIATTGSSQDTPVGSIKYGFKKDDVANGIDGSETFGYSTTVTLASTYSKFPSLTTTGAITISSTTSTTAFTHNFSGGYIPQNALSVTIGSLDFAVSGINTSSATLTAPPVASTVTIPTGTSAKFKALQITFPLTTTLPPRAVGWSGTITGIDGPLTVNTINGTTVVFDIFSQSIDSDISGSFTLSDNQGITCTDVLSCNRSIQTLLDVPNQKPFMTSDILACDGCPVRIFKGLSAASGALTNVRTYLWYTAGKSGAFACPVPPTAASGTSFYLIANCWPICSTTITNAYAVATGVNPTTNQGGQCVAICNPGYKMVSGACTGCGGMAVVPPNITFTYDPPGTCSGTCGSSITPAPTGMNFSVQLLNGIINGCLVTCASPGTAPAADNSACNLCLPGSYSTGNQSICSTCAVGSYSSTSGATGCTMCSIGTYQPSTSATGCMACSAGTYQQNTGQGSCSTCSAGTYQTGTSATGCTSCSVGYYSTQIGSVTNSCMACSAGTYQASAGQGSCSTCAIGTYQQNTGQGSCTSCSVGYYSTQNGSTTNSCMACSAGTYQASAGQGSCSTCATGTYSSSAAASCASCAPGTYQPNTGATGPGQCTSCSTGTYQGNTGQGSCSTCATGTYAATTGRTMCSTCATGTYQASIGQGSCSTCSAGTYQPSGGQGSCSTCATGTYSSSGAGSCSTCATGTYQPSGGQGSCSTCATGTYQNSSGQGSCSTCSAGTYQPSGGQGSCSTCAIGTYSSSGAGSCSTCSAGTYQGSTGATGVSQCTQCNQGTYSSAGAGSCTSCPLGTYGTQYIATTGASHCVSCSSGYYSSTIGATGCTRCGQNTYTTSTGSTGAAACSCNSPNVRFTSGSFTYGSVTYTQNVDCCPAATFAIGTQTWTGTAISVSSDCSFTCPSFTSTTACSGFTVDSTNRKCQMVCKPGYSYSQSATTNYGCVQCTNSYTSTSGTHPSYDPSCNATCVLDDADPNAGATFGSGSATQSGSCTRTCSGGYSTQSVTTTGITYLGITTPGAVLVPKCCPTWTASAGAYVGFSVVAGGACSAACYVTSTGATSVNDGTENKSAILTGTTCAVSCADGTTSRGTNCCITPTTPTGVSITWNVSGCGFTCSCAGGCTSLNATSVTTSGRSCVLTCKPGHVKDVYGSCIPCNPGTYENNGSCSMCLKGTYATTTGATGCTSCATGTYGTTAGATGCTACSAGTYQGSTGATGVSQCTPCNQGTYSAAGAGSCTSCATGTYQSSTGATGCTACSAGTYRGSTGATGVSQCTQCNQGTYSSAGAGSCASCSAGYSGARAGATGVGECIACSAGYFAGSQGSASCTQCNQGTYSSSTATSCASCSVGYRGARAGATGSGECIACSAGYYAGSQGSASCTQCNQGTYSSSTATSCASCSIGYSGARAGATGVAECIACSAGYYAGSQGSASCTACSPGTYQASTGQGSCSTCSAGTYQNSTGLGSCSTCATGTYSGVGASSCTTCATGYYQGSTGATGCRACSAGTYQPSTGQGSCSTCSAGTYQGSAGQVSCTSCSAGTYSSVDGATGSGQCYTCLAGTFSGTGASGCTECAIDTFQDQDGQSSCSGCPTGSNTRGSRRYTTCLCITPSRNCSYRGPFNECQVTEPGYVGSGTGRTLSCTRCFNTWNGISIWGFGTWIYPQIVYNNSCMNVIRNPTYIETSWYCPGGRNGNAGQIVTDRYNLVCRSDTNNSAV